jgi:pseudouridine-5'-phosphate glycosidase
MWVRIIHLKTVEKVSTTELVHTVAFLQVKSTTVTTTPMKFPDKTRSPTPEQK